MSKTDEDTRLTQANNFLRKAIYGMSAAVGMHCGKDTELNVALVLGQSCEDMLHAHFLSEDIFWPASPTRENLTTLLREHGNDRLAEIVSAWDRASIPSCKQLWDALMLFPE